jgi:pimeloyl-ACP methyl ester carboxylesterase
MESRVLDGSPGPLTGGGEYTRVDDRRNAWEGGLSTLDVKGVEIPWSATPGVGRPVVLLAGLGWRATGSVRSATAPQGLPVVALDYPRRWPRRPLDSVTAVAGLFSAAIDALELSGVHLLGVSFGGMVALRLALDRPDLVASLGLVSTAAAGADVAGRWRLPLSRGLAAILPPETFYEFYRRLGPDLVGTAALSQDAAARLWSDPMGRRKMADLLRAVASFDARGRLRDVGCPTLVLHGHEDQVIGPTTATSLARGIPGARRMMIERADHFAFITHRQQVLHELEQFWKSI